MFFHHLHHLSTTSPKIKENQLTNHAQQHAVSSSFLHKPIASQLRVHLTPAVADLLPCEFGWTNICNAPLVDCLVVIPYSDGGVKVWLWHQFHLLNRMWTTEKPKIHLFKGMVVWKFQNMIFVLQGLTPVDMIQSDYSSRWLNQKTPPSYPLFIQGWLTTKDGVSGWCSNFVHSFAKSLPNCYLKISGPLFGSCPIYIYIYIYKQRPSPGIDCRTSRSFPLFSGA